MCMCVCVCVYTHVRVCLRSLLAGHIVKLINAVIHRGNQGYGLLGN